VEDLDYLKFYSPQQREAILHSLDAPIPAPLPPLAPDTISYYRRSNQPVYRTKSPESLQMDGHMVYESLWVLASVEEKEFDNYLAVVKEFEQDLSTYFAVNSVDIREMAVIAAGNKVIGRESDILKIVEADPRQLWVLINHIYDKKVSFKPLLKYLEGDHEIVFKTLYELTNNKEDEAIQALVSDEIVLESIIGALHSKQEEIKKYAIRIIGNIVAEQNEHTDTLHRYKLLDNTFDLLLSSNDEVRRDACWLISNLCCDRVSSTQVIRQGMVMAKLVDLFTSEGSLEIQRELTHIFGDLAHFAEKYEAFTLLANENVLHICYEHLCRDDNDLSSVTLFLLNELLELGENYKSEDDPNFFCVMMGRMGDLRNEVSKKSYS
jgi:hypothetical protein